MHVKGRRYDSARAILPASSTNDLLRADTVAASVGPYPLVSNKARHQLAGRAARAARSDGPTTDARERTRLGLPSVTERVVGT